MDTSFTNSTGMSFVRIEAGQFETTAPFTRTVELTHPFFMGIYCVTQRQFESIMGFNPSVFPNRAIRSLAYENYPVTNVSWQQANDFCNLLNEQPEEKLKGRSYRLPTEAEWEYSCRSGSKGLYSINPTENQLSAYAHYLNCIDKKPIDGSFLEDLQFAKNNPLTKLPWDDFLMPLEVGKKKPNSWGLFDMHGNVWEWCLDVFGEKFQDLEIDPKGPIRGSHRVIRGGCFASTAEMCSNISRQYRTPGYSHSSIGFRVILELEKSPTRAFKQKSKFVNFRKYKSGEQKTETIVNSLGMTLVGIPPGKFTMGSLRETDPTLNDGRLSKISALPMKMHELERFARYSIAGSSDPEIGLDVSYKYSQQIHEVSLTKPFYISSHLVTQEQYELVMGKNPSRFKKPKNPVESVTWFEATEFCRRLSTLDDEAKANRVYRLPTEAEWEYVCRCDSDDDYCFGSHVESLSDYAWYVVNSGKKQLDNIDLLQESLYEKTLVGYGCSPQEVGQKMPNAIEVFDMHGNVCEWCADWADHYEDVIPEDVKTKVKRQSFRYAIDPAEAVSDQVVSRQPKTWSSSDFYGLEVTDPKGPASGKAKIIRGGSWCGDAERCRSSYRGDMQPDRSNDSIGFRIVMQYGSSELIEAEKSRREFRTNHEKYVADELTNSLGMRFRGVPVSDSTISLPGNEKTKIKFRVADSFFLGTFQVTQSQFEAVMGFNPSHYIGDDLPVQNVSWDEACEFCAHLSAISAERLRGFRYRLPSELEWEIACRCGSNDKFFFGSDDSRLPLFAWFDRNSGLSEIDSARLWKEEPNSEKFYARLFSNGCRPHTVGSKDPNPWGFHDMYGNVREWCSSIYGNYVLQSYKWFFGPDDEEFERRRVVKGGSFLDSASRCSSEFRFCMYPYERNFYTGFRVVVVPPAWHYSV